ncbi:MAG: lipid A oxidase [Hyphomicrobiaceae bacterium]
MRAGHRWEFARDYGAGWRHAGRERAYWRGWALGGGRVASAVATAMLFAIHVPIWVGAIDTKEPARDAAAAAVSATTTTGSRERVEAVVAGYVGAPFYHRSDVHLKRPDGTDARFRDLGWDGDALHFPIDGGVRLNRWHGAFGWAIDFLHNKAIARLGKGAHGRRLKHPVIETVDVEGTIAGRPAAPRIKLTDVYERLEFTHGHNMLFLTPLARLGEVFPGVRPYVGIGFGAAVPHVEVTFPGRPDGERTYEYQYVGPAVQLMAGLEYRRGRGQFFLEYKFSYAWVAANLTGGKSWKNFFMPGDLWRQLSAWRNGNPAPYGTLSTVLGAHQPILGGGYQVQGPLPVGR